ncbi:hypothetical protein BDP81DRAFT_465153 [Colletotrichum phormii]|uniref:AAA+ ATPase domain-containing protein n=1 Tax=Colletotrichum phormii TaxID=359342 RepID=A0AAJ0E9E5_9PEZI|nr:uncharacterized protein BDP81DRAFT_465153 [Colletotrichum phormii]KAK1623849.1 hypothetical protein BDP81DRAFT_465153 [Colletotrichum phormii]
MSYPSDELNEDRLHALSANADAGEGEQEFSQDAPSLFISSTISRDGTLSQASQEQGILSQLKDQLSFGTLEAHIVSHHQGSLGYLPRHSPPSRPHSRSPPPSKALKNSKWRERLKAEREMSPDASSKEDNVGNIEQAIDLHILEEKKEPDHDVSLAETLALMTERQLGIDFLDQSKKISTFASYLLDTIQILESQADCRDAESSGSDSGSDSQDEEVAVGQPPGYQVVHRIFCTARFHDHDGMNQWLERAKSPHQRAENQRFRVRNYVSTPSGRLERLRIVSPVLQKALKQVAEFQVYRKSEHDDFAAEMEAPYLFILEYTKEVILPLTRFLVEHYETEYTEAEELFRQGYVNAYHVHKLFRPNQMLLVRKKGEPKTAFVLSKYSLAKKEEIILHGWRWHYNGHNLQRTTELEAIDFVPEDKTKICDLVVHPVEFAREEDVTTLIQRGKTLWSMRDQVYICYTGWDKGSKHQYASARFMVDTATYQIMHGHSNYSSSEPSPANDPWPMRVNHREDLPHKVEMLLPATVQGFNLEEKNWVNLYVENTHAVDWNYKAFDRLVLDAKTKEMIRALVDVQTSAKKMDDIIAGKGNGLIILLHGSPGTGKTLTAESVAEIAKKPLYRVTCGDIGTDVEKYLETVMYLGKTWDCVLLLDEADVFLEERTLADLQRNSLVSVFLRLLEYYEGILILTSNRVGTFDGAFKSRIQVAIHYDNLAKMSRKAIWQNFFDMIQESTEEDANMLELERRLDHLAKEDMNGRQIRNALLTARQLAKHRKERLDWEHLSQVIDTSAAFNKYLKAVRGHTDEQWARGESLR